MMSGNRTCPTRLKSCVAAASFAFLIGAIGSASAQTINDRFQAEANAEGDQRLLVELAPGGTTSYNSETEVVTLEGDVKLYYGGRVVEADRVVYSRKTKRVLAEGNARLTDTEGTKYFGDRIDLTDDFGEGFIDQFRAVTTDNLRISAPRAERTAGDQTVFEQGTYTPCLPCADNPAKPPLWQVKAKKVIAKNQEQMIYFEDAYLEFWGIPTVWVPYFSAPDPSVRRKSGFLPPRIVNKTSLGFGLSTPYFFNLAPNYDITLTPTVLSRQGVLSDVEWRHRLEDGQYNIALSGIYQLDPSAFLAAPDGPGDREFRGSVRTNGEFRINDKWKWGWSASASTDRFFYSNYDISSSGLSSATFLQDVTSTAYLTGQGERSWFDLRGYYFQAIAAREEQSEIPAVHPTLEYDRKFEALGGELGISIGATNLSRREADVQALSIAASSAPETGCLTAINGQCAIIRGIAGSYSQLDATLSWRKTIIDPIGQMWTPFAVAEVDGTFFSVDSNSGFEAQQNQVFSASEDEFNLRAMPTIGLDYRYPFFAVTDFGSHVIEPIAQIIASPDEMKAGALPNEEAQSLSFDDTNLFDWNKFSGDGRQEGGVRANIGLQYTWNLPGGGWVNLMGGRSFHLSGRNSFANADATNTGLNSGLDTDRSDYVARAIIQPIKGFSLSARGRFDTDTFELKRLEGIADFNMGRVGASATYARFEPQPELGYDRVREGLALSASLGVTDYWRVYGGAVFDLDIQNEQRAAGLTSFTNRFQIASANLGIGYRDECTSLTASWTRSNSLTATGVASTSDIYLLKLELRTLGDVGYSLRSGTGSSEPGVAQ
jgi:LPS-assembly protein